MGGLERGAGGAGAAPHALRWLRPPGCLAGCMSRDLEAPCGMAFLGGLARRRLSAGHPKQPERLQNPRELAEYERRALACIPNPRLARDACVLARELDRRSDAQKK